MLVVVGGARVARVVQELGDRVDAGPVIRVMERIDTPSTNIERICARFSVESLFMG